MASEIREELEAIRAEHGGLLRAGDVIEYAKDPNTELHGRFDWNDTTAAEKYRLVQARNLIKVYYINIEPVQEPVQVYISLDSQRKLPGGGYRHIEEVLASKAMREEMLDKALADFALWQAKYNVLSELAEIFEAADKVIKKRLRRHKPKRKQPKGRSERRPRA